METRIGPQVVTRSLNHCEARVAGVATRRKVSSPAMVEEVVETVAVFKDIVLLIILILDNQVLTLVQEQVELVKTVMIVVTLEVMEVIIQEQMVEKVAVLE